MPGPRGRAPTSSATSASLKATFASEAATIDWIEAVGDQVRVHTGHDSALIRESLPAIAGRLDPAEFAHVHPSTIVRLSRIRELAPMDNGDYKLFLTTGATLTLSRAHRKQVIPRLTFS